MSAEFVGEYCRSFRLRAHAHVECAHASHQQPGIKRSDGAAELLPHLANARPQRALARCGKSARDNIGMSVEVFGRRVHDDVGAQRKRPGKDRRGHGRSDAQDGADAMRDLGNRGDVG
jgi:hypothetical protein